MLQKLRDDPRLRPLRRILGPVVNWLYFRSEGYIWHELDLTTVRPVTSRFVRDLDIRLATHEDLPAVRRIGVPEVERYDEFRARGGELWLGDTPEGIAVAFWIFHSGMPLYPWYELPEKTVAIEHTTASMEVRGLGFAPAALTSKFHDLAQAGYKSCVTKIRDDNRVSLKSARRIGFHPTLLMYERRILGRERLVLEAWTPFARHLGSALRSPGRIGDPAADGRRA